MPETDYRREWPRLLARAVNLVPGLGWTSDYCAGGCGYPVTGTYRIQIDSIEGVPVYMMVCALGGACERSAKDDPRSADGESYGHIRPDLAEAVSEADPKITELNISFGR